MLLSSRFPIYFRQGWSTARQDVEYPVEMPSESQPLAKRWLAIIGVDEEVDFVDDIRDGFR